MQETEGQTTQTVIYILGLQLKQEYPKDHQDNLYEYHFHQDIIGSKEKRTGLIGSVNGKTQLSLTPQILETVCNP